MILQELCKDETKEQNGMEGVKGVIHPNKIPGTKYPTH